MKNLLQVGVCIAVGLASGLQANWPKYVEIDAGESDRINQLHSGGEYTEEFYSSVICRNSDVKTVIEIGSRDGKDALKLSEFYKCHVYAFECNPNTLEDCYTNIEHNPNVTIVPQAAWNKTGKIDFYPIVEIPNKAYNPGASSCFRVSKTGHHKTYVQEKITVNATRLDEWLDVQNIPQVDLLCMDAQGATLNILEGLGDKLAGVKYIITEADHKAIYEGEALRDSIDQFMEEHGFRMYIGKMNRFFGDYLYVRKDIIAGWWGPDEV